MNIVNDWAERAAQARQAENELRPINREALFDALMAADITSVTVEFDGAGDEGQIESVHFFRDEAEMPQPEGHMILMRPANDSTTRTERTFAMAEGVEEIVYDLLAQSHKGWEDGDGAYGDFRFEVRKRSVSLSFNARFTDSENFQHSF